MRNVEDFIKNWRSYPIHCTVDLKTGVVKFFKNGKEWHP